MMRLLLATLLMFSFAGSAGAISYRREVPIVTPSKAAAVRAVKKELARDNRERWSLGAQGKRSVICMPLTTKLYNCRWLIRFPGFFEETGKAKVRFYQLGIDVTFYGRKCVNLDDVGGTGEIFCA